MSLKQEIETWVEAIAFYDNNDFDSALRTFGNIPDTAKILFNCGVIHATLGEHKKAVQYYQRAIHRDNYLAIAYFQQGVSNFLIGDFEEAMANFNDALRFLRGNRFINYEQLGLKFRLYSCEVLFNRGLCSIYIQEKEAGMEDLHIAAKEKEKPDHDVIDEAIAEEAEGYTVFSIPVGVIYRPNAAKVKNLKTKDYLGKARLIAASEQGNTFAGSASADTKAQAAAINRSVDDRPPNTISYGASHMVKPNLYSRSRQQSEPPVHRNMFPPTPPPENDQIRPAFMVASTSPPGNPLSQSRASTLTNTPPSKPVRPEPLNLEAITQEKPRIGTTRTASEPRGPSSRRLHIHRERDHSGRPRLFGETTPHRPHSNGDEADLDEYPEELYSMDPRTTRQHSSPQKPRSSHHYSSDTGSQRQRRSGRSKSRQRREHYSIDEEPSEDPGTASTTSSLDEYEILHNAGGGLSRPRGQSSSRRGTSHSGPYVYRLKDVRVKVHCGDDARFIMLTPDVAFAAFVDKVREKLHLKGGFKCKIQDEGDLITMGDGDDWDMAMSSVRKEARAEGVEMGKMEVWVIDVA
ncbi:hypothetical protein HO133_001762 [Letharia lupina]|uniref:PB1 domain-containing protein n=1 Tax=Letharia lupina TaxID=560253 RepID=A0A8H6FBK3_9LECA|nr:uncharacterized protein HO133_001762 [Letharia lupina]KAF6221794.1 hypothetical protein HO133_001762 [Letharia lupina]